MTDNNWPDGNVGDDWDISEVAPSKEIARYADESMFTAEAATDTHPRARLIDAPSDPLGKLAFIAKAYQGKFPASYEAISDADRRYYIQDMEKNILGMPSESVMFHFVLENVTRSFTHQLVRTRHASYAQESMRFAVKEDFPVQLPPSLIGTLSADEWWSQEFPNPADMERWARSGFNDPGEYMSRYASDQQKMRFVWDEGVKFSADHYKDLIDMGMPAEDARGLAPHNIVTKLNWVIDLRSLMAVAGQRLCTQAQFEHRVVWNSIINELYAYGERQTYRTTQPENTHAALNEIGDTQGNLAYELSSGWQYDVLAQRFQPICYQTGGCKFGSDFDRYCNIRDRVNANEAINRPSKDWGEAWTDPRTMTAEAGSKNWLGIPAIHPREWLAPDAAIRKTGDWRSEEARKNIEGRR